MYFRTRYRIELDEFWFRLRDRGTLPRRLRFGERAGGDWIELDQVELEPDEEGVPGFGEDTVVRIGCRIDVSPETEALLEEIAGGRNGGELGELKPVPGHPGLLSDYDATTGFWEEVEAIRRQLDRHTSMFLGTMLWRLGLHGGPHEVRSRLDEVEFSVAGNEWCQLSFVFKLRLADRFGPTISLNTLQEFSELQAGTEQPLGHNIFQVAWRLRDSDPRTSVVMAVSALETGLKECVGDLLPQTNWLLENIPSPPVMKLLREFVQQLPGRHHFSGEVKRPPNPHLTIVGKGVEARNKIVHGGELKPELAPSRIGQELLLAVRDILWMLDYYRGQGWALEHLREETRRGLEGTR